MRVKRWTWMALPAVCVMFLAACGGGGGGGSGGGGIVTPPDTTPNVFAFTDQADVAPSSPITSAPVTITGIDAPAAISVSGGTYSIGCTTTYVAAAATVAQGQQVCVRHTSAATASTKTDTTLSVGGVSDTFSSTTGASLPIDTTRCPSARSR